MQKYNTKPKEFTEMPKIFSHLLSNIFFFQEQSCRKLALKKKRGGDKNSHMLLRVLFESYTCEKWITTDVHGRGERALRIRRWKEAGLLMLSVRPGFQASFIPSSPLCSQMHGFQ